MQKMQIDVCHISVWNVESAWMLIVISSGLCYSAAVLRKTKTILCTIVFAMSTLKKKMVCGHTFGFKVPSLTLLVHQLWF